MDCIIKYTTKEHPEVRTFEYRGKNITDAIEILDFYLQKRNETVTSFKLEQKGKKDVQN